METYPKIERLAFKGLGTEIDVQIVVENGKQALLAKKNLLEIEKRYELVEKKFSRFDRESELSQLNRRIGQCKKASAEMIGIAKKAVLYNKETNGIFDPRIIGQLEMIGYDKDFDFIGHAENAPSAIPLISDGAELGQDIIIENDAICFKKRMDFSGIVKGWTTDKMAEFLSSAGWEHFLVDSGGDIYFAGCGTDGKKWRVDIAGIASKSLVLELSGKGVATSGIGKRKWERGGKRFHHLINPRKPDEFSFDVQSVTVVDGTAEQADVLAKTLFIAGKEQAKEIAKQKGIACVILEYGGRAWISPEIKQYLFVQ